MEYPTIFQELVEMMATQQERSKYMGSSNKDCLMASYMAGSTIRMM